MIFTAVPREGIEIVWEDVKPLLDKAIKTSKGKFNIEDLIGKVISCETYKQSRETIKMRKIEL